MNPFEHMHLNLGQRVIVFAVAKAASSSNCAWEKSDQTFGKRENPQVRPNETHKKWSIANP